MTWVTCSTVAADTPYRPLRTFDTVEIETPASAATCCIVTRPREDGSGRSPVGVPSPDPTTRPGPMTSSLGESSSMGPLLGRALGGHTARGGGCAVQDTATEGPGRGRHRGGSG